MRFRFKELYFLLALSIFFSAKVSANYFDSLLIIDNKGERLLTLRRLSTGKLFDLDSTHFFTAYQELMQIADQKNDPKLKAYALFLMGKHFSTSTYFNEQQALIYFNKAKTMVIEGGYRDIEAEIYHEMGWMYYWGKKYAFAFDYFLKANALIQKIGYSNFFFASKHLYDLGFLYFDFDYFSKAKTYVLEAMRYPSLSKKYEMDQANTLGLIYRNLRQSDSAIFCFSKALRLARELKDTAWIGLISGNLGYVYYQEKDYDRALPLFLVDGEFSKKSENWNSLSNVLNKIRIIYIDQHKTKLAETTKRTLDSFITKADSKSVHWNYFLTNAQLSALEKDYLHAYHYLDSARLYYEEITRRNDIQMIAREEDKLQIENELANMQLLESQKNKQLLLRNAIIGLSFLLLVIAAQFIARQRSIQKRNLEKLDNAKSELKLYLESLRDKNLLIEKFKNEIKSLQSSPDPHNEAEKEQIILKLQKSTILTNDDWDEFRHLFEKVHTDFFKTLKLHYPQLTNAEVRLISLIKLNLSKKEMAEMLGISPDTIKKTRQRIRKKLDLVDENSLDKLALKL